MPLSFGNISSFIKRCNLFTSPVNFRYKLDQDYNTVLGGWVSIALIVLLISVFYGSWVSLLNKDDINLSTVTYKELQPSLFQVNSNQFMFAIGVMGINLTDPNQKKYFNFSMKKISLITESGTRKYYETPFTLEPCQLSHWESLGEQFVLRYKRLGLSDFLCPNKNISLEIGGKWTSQVFSYFQIRFDPCQGDNCRTKEQIDSFLKTYKAFFFDFFYSNTLLNPDQAEPISMLLQDKDFAICSPKLSIQTNIYLGQYSMITDESIFPWSTEQVSTGFIVNRAEKQTFNKIPSENQNQAYYRLFLRKSDVKLEISRKFRKMDDMLSYIGGLFGIIVLTIGLIIKYYGQCAFELQMCQKVFDYHNKKQLQEPSKQILATNINLMTDQTMKDQSCQKQVEVQKIIEPKDFGFFDFLMHIILYTPLRKIFHFSWKRMEVYEESLEEMRYKLDISQLMEKLNFYDRSINALFDENQLKLLYLQDKFHFQEVRQQRKMLHFREGISKRIFEQRKVNGTESDLMSRGREQKKSLKEIAQSKSKKRIYDHSFLQVEQKSMITSRNNMEERPKTQNGKLTSDIKKALEKLDQQIDNGDVVATRIYNRLQYDLLEAYEKNSQVHRHKRSTLNSIKLYVKSIQTISDTQKDLGKETKRTEKYFCDSKERK